MDSVATWLPRAYFPSVWSVKMASYDIVQTNFSRGELSPRLKGRIDFQGYFNGVEDMENFVVLPHGGITKRPGTRFVAETALSLNPSRLLPFQFNTEESYVLEFTSQEVRFIRDGAQIQVNEVDTAFTNGDFSSGGTGWTDASNGTGNVLFQTIATLGDGALLQSEGVGNEAVLRQSLTVDPADATSVHSVRVSSSSFFARKDIKFTVRVGSSAGANDLYERDMLTGEHVFDVDPGGNTTIYVDFVAEFDYNVFGYVAILDVEVIPSGPLRVLSPYTSADLDTLDWAQSADILFLACDGKPPYEFRRFGVADFSIVEYDYRDGPYLETNLTDTTLTPSGISGDITITASSTEGINGGTGFVAFSDEGRLIRLKSTDTEQDKTAGDDVTEQFSFTFFAPSNNSIKVTLTNTSSSVVQNISPGATVEAFEGQDYSLTLNTPSAGGTVDFGISKAPATGIEVTIVRDITVFGWVEILNVTSSTTAEVTVRGVNALGSASATKEWRLGAWADQTGWPRTVTFHNERLCWGGSGYNPQGLWMTKVADFNNFSPSEVQGEVLDDNAINITIAANEVNAIRWLSSINSGLAIGTSGSEFLVRSATTTKPIAPTSIEAVRQTSRGSAGFIPPASVGLSTMFVQRGAAAIRELAFDFNVDGLQSRDFSLVSEHLLRPKIKRIAYQQSPDSVLWAIREDGILLGFTIESDQQVFAWHKHNLGGVFTNSNNVVVDDIVTISRDDGAERLYMIARREINGLTAQFIEYLDPPWHNSESAIEEAFFVDSGLSGDFGSPTSVVSGLDHLEGETVSVLADGAVHPDVIVSSGQITLNYEVSKVQIGLPYTANVQTFPFDDGVRGDTLRGKTKRIHQLHVLFHESVGAKVGRETLDVINFRDPSMNMDEAVPPFSGLKSVRVPCQWDALAYARVVSDQPLPCTVLNIVAEMEYN